MYRKIIISLLFVSIMVAGCSKKNADDPPSGFKPEDISGRWKVVPSAENEVLYFGRVVILEKSSGNETLEITADSLGIRIMKQGHLSGYFAFAEKHQQNWKGIWNDSLVELSLQPN